MLVLSSLVVALITVCVLVRCFDRKVAVVEILAPFLLSLGVALLVKFLVSAGMTRDTEYWGTWVARCAYQEPWTEWEDVDDYCDESYTDAAGKQQTRRVKCGSHREYHDRGNEWWVETASGDQVVVDRSHYADLLARFGTHRREQGHHGDYHRATGFHDGGDGYLHYTTWPGTDATFRPVTLSKTYTNKVQASDQSLFHYEEIDPEEVLEYRLVPYPPIRDFYWQDAILGASGPVLGPANDRLVEWNARLGAEKQLKMFVLVFEDQPIEAALKQEAYWGGGNKNEFVLCIGTDRERRVRWARAFSWCEDETLKVVVRDQARSMKVLDLDAVVASMVPQLRARFRRKEFHDFDYLRVEVPWWGQVANLLACVALNAGLGFWLVNNDLDSGESVLDRIGVRRRLP